MSPLAYIIGEQLYKTQRITYEYKFTNNQQIKQHKESQPPRKHYHYRNVSYKKYKTL